MAPRSKSAQSGDSSSRPSPARRRVVRFVVAFAALLAGGFALLSLRPVNAAVVEPFTRWIAVLGAGVLELLGHDLVRHGTILRGSAFTVRIENGCNGLEAMVIYAAAVLATPVPWGSRLTGMLLGLGVIQGVNLLRVVALYLTGLYRPEWFHASHTVLWQSIVIAVALGLWVVWVQGVSAHRSK